VEMRYVAGERVAIWQMPKDLAAERRVFPWDVLPYCDDFLIVVHGRDLLVNENWKQACERVLQVREPGTAPQSREAACQGKDTRGATGAQCAAPRAPGDRPRPRPIFPLIFFPKEVHACETGHCAPIQDGLQNIADSPAAGLSHRHTCSC
jgi:hypothetical protein